ncbi:MAG TPA: long-chain fatty acid--CoA ligase [Clostridiaceae bacterium]|nr:long-chain fatty acid--CoA ligase [Clostridiaceae bacterium]
MTKTNSIYNYPLIEVRQINDLRDMVRQSKELYADNVAYLVKDPVAAGKISPYDVDIKQKRKDEQDFLPIYFDRAAADFEAFGSWLYEKFPQGARVAVIGETRYEWYVTYMATVNGNGIIIPLDKELPSSELLTMLKRAKVDVLVYADIVYPKLQEVEDQLPPVTIAMDPPQENTSSLYFWDLLAEGHKIREEGNTSYDDLHIDPDEMRIILFTSGTTTMSKAVMLSHRNICVNLMGMCSMINIDESDTCLSVLPIHHTYECTCGFLCEFYRGTTVAVCPGLRYIVSSMKEIQPSYVLMVPLMVESVFNGIMRKINSDAKLKKKFNFGLKLSNLLLKIGIDVRKKIFKDIHAVVGQNLRFLIVGGAAISGDLIKDMRALGIHCFQGYGLTECAPILALNREFYYNDNSAGLPLPGVDIKIINADEDGIGEIIGRGPNVMLGYYEDEEKTAAAIDDEGFYHTGDIGYIDENAFVIITGRKLNVIVAKNGKNIFPEEIEFILMQHDLIKEVIVHEVEENDNMLLSAIIFPDQDVMDNDEELKDKELDSTEVKARLEEIVKNVNKDLVTYKAVRRVEIRTKEFEKNTSKKIVRAKKYD